MTMPQMAVPDAAVDLYEGYLEWLEQRRVGNRTFLSGARSFLARYPDPQCWAARPLAERLAVGSQTRPLLNFLMLNGHLRPGYDYLLERKLHSVLWASPLIVEAPFKLPAPGWPRRSRSRRATSSRRRCDVSGYYRSRTPTIQRFSLPLLSS